MKTFRMGLFFTLALAMVITGWSGAVQAQTTLKFMGWVNSFDFLKPGWANCVSTFEKKYPDIKLEYISTQWDQTMNQATTAILAGNVPDIISVVPGWVPQLQFTGDGLEPLDKHWSKEELADYPKAAMEAMSFDGRPRAIPFNPGPIMMVYNRLLLKEAGLDPDRPPKTFPEFTEAIKKICALPNRNGGKTYGIALRTARVSNTGHWAMPIVWGHGGYVIGKDGKVNVTNDGFVKGFQWYQDIIRAGCSPEAFNVNETRNLFAQGRAGFIFEGPWAKGLVINIAGDKYKFAPDGDMWVAPMPAAPDGKVYQTANHNSLVIPAGAKNKEAAVKFIRHMVENPAVVEYSFETSKLLSSGKMSLLRSGKMGQDEWTQMFVNTLAISNPLPSQHPKWEGVLDLLAPTLQKVIGGADAGKELKRAQRQIDRLMSR